MVWQLDCFVCLLKLICQFVVDLFDLDLVYYDVFVWFGIVESYRKRIWLGKLRKVVGDYVKGFYIL